MAAGFILIGDRAPPQRAKVVQADLAEHPEISVAWLPSYAPDLNPEAYGQGNLKQHLKNILPEDKFVIRQLLNAPFARIRRQPELILSFFHLAGLRVKQLS